MYIDRKSKGDNYMQSKFELSISTGYVPDWGITEAFRELYQNAIDNETINPENKASFSFVQEDTENTEGAETGTVRITNKTSVLTKESLLLGSTTKADDENTIGKHGEGYKIAFMVLLRNGKKIKVYNSSAKEIWEVRLVKSRKYNGQLVTTVFVNKNAVWKKKTDDNLTIEVSGVTHEEYKEVIDKNLHLHEYRSVAVKGYGEILLDEHEAGRVYVEGLYVCEGKGFKYGYNLKASRINLDRDRKLVDSFNLEWETSGMWVKLSSENEEYRKRFTALVSAHARDVSRSANNDCFTYMAAEAYEAVYKQFLEENGNNAIPVTDNLKYEEVKRSSSYKPIIVSEDIATMIHKSKTYTEPVEIAVKPVSVKLSEWLEKVRNKLSDDEIENFESLVSEVKDIE